MLQFHPQFRKFRLIAGAMACVIFCSFSQNVRTPLYGKQRILLPEHDQFRLGSNLFQDGKYFASWQAYQDFLYNYPKSSLASDAQFMIAEAIFTQVVQGLRADGKLRDEIAWEKLMKSKSQKVSQIDFATFSEAVEQYKIIYKKHKKSGIADTALFRMAEAYHNMNNFPSAIAYYRKVQKEFPQSSSPGTTYRFTVTLSTPDRLEPLSK